MLKKIDVINLEALAADAGESLGRTGYEHDTVKTFISNLLSQVGIGHPEERESMQGIATEFFHGYGRGAADSEPF